MGLFSKSKNETKDDVPPVPPVGTSQGSSGNMPEPAMQAPAEIKKPDEESQDLSPPPIPGGSLDEIKNEVASKKDSIPTPERGQLETPQMEEQEEKEDKEANSQKDEDSLFDFSELDVNMPLNTQIETKNDENTKLSLDKNSAETDVSFIKHRHTPTKDTYFVTTSQFKSLLEIIEAVKNKVKDASETHLKLLDIKAEEDIEFENLRKDFQFIEDKLYEVDNIIFDK